MSEGAKKVTTGNPETAAVTVTVCICVCFKTSIYKLDADSRKLRGDVESRGPWSCSVPSAARTLLQGPRQRKLLLIHMVLHPDGSPIDPMELSQPKEHFFGSFPDRWLCVVHCLKQ